jgi:PEP-CTERM motif
MVKLNCVFVLVALATCGLASASERAETVDAARIQSAVYHSRQDLRGSANITAAAAISVDGTRDGLQRLGSRRSLGDHGVIRSYRQVAGNAARNPKGRLVLSAGPVAEPETFTMLLSGMGLMVLLARRRKKAHDLSA